MAANAGNIKKKKKKKDQTVPLEMQSNVMKQIIKSIEILFLISDWAQGALCLKVTYYHIFPFLFYCYFFFKKKKKRLGLGAT